MGVIGTDQHSLWHPKRSHWSKSGGDQVKVSEWDLALGMDRDMLYCPETDLDDLGS